MKYEYWIDNVKYETGSLFNISWKDLHRDEGPAYKAFNAENNLIGYRYYNHGHLHNENGPAYCYTRNKEYWLFNFKLTKNQWKFLVKNNSNHPNLWDKNFKMLAALFL